MREKTSRKTGLLRFLAALCAVGIIAGSLCFGAKTYFNRTVDAMVAEGLAENGVLAEHPVFRDMEEQDIKDYARDLFPVVIRQDRAGMEELIRRVMDIYIGTLTPEVRYLYTRSEERYRQITDETFARVFSNGDFSDGLKELIEKTRSRLGIRWYLIEAVAYSRELMTAGFALAGAALLLWLILGGLSGGIVRTGLLPALVIAVACAGLILFLSGKIEPAHLQDTGLEKFITTYI